MVGNAVPPRLAKFLALAIKESLNVSQVKDTKPVNILVAYYKDDNQLRLTLKKSTLLCTCRIAPWCFTNTERHGLSDLFVIA